MSVELVLILVLLVVFLIAIVIYITVRFEFRMALATLGALLHDILVVIGAYAILQLPVTPATVVAMAASTSRIR